MGQMKQKRVANKGVTYCAQWQWLPSSLFPPSRLWQLFPPRKPSSSEIYEVHWAACQRCQSLARCWRPELWSASIHLGTRRYRHEEWQSCLASEAPRPDLTSFALLCFCYCIWWPFLGLPQPVAYLILLDDRHLFAFHKTQQQKG